MTEIELKIDKTNLLIGDCLERMKSLPENSIDSVVTDPPAGISFMGKSWDTFDKNMFGKAGEEGDNDLKVIKNFEILPRYSNADLQGFQDFICSVFLEVYRILKPGGHCLVWAIPRTSHHTAMGIERAGFEIRDRISHVFGSGFPKSLNIGSKIDELQGNRREVIETTPNRWMGKGNVYGYSERDEKGVVSITKGTTLYEGWGTALKPAMEDWWLCRKPLSEKTVAENVLKWGTGGINIDGCRVETGETIRVSGDFKQMQRWKEQDGRSPKDKDLIVNKPYKHNQGRFPANFIHDGSEEVLRLFPDTKSGFMRADTQRTTGGGYSGGFPKNRVGARDTHGDSGSAARFFMKYESNNECSFCCAYTKTTKELNSCQNKSKTAHNAGHNSLNTGQTKGSIVQQSVITMQEEKLVNLVKFAGNLCEQCAMSFVQEVVAIKSLGFSQEGLQVIQDFIGNYGKCTLFQNLVQYVEVMGIIDTTQTTTDLLKLFGSVNLAITNCIKETTKSAPNRFIYLPKASKGERNEGVEIGNNHPTVKPIKLMEYLCRLITPKGGIVLDPFMGSGTTGIAAANEGFRFVGIEREPDYFKIACARIKAAITEKEKTHQQGNLFEGEAS